MNTLDYHPGPGSSPDNLRFLILQADNTADREAARKLLIEAGKLAPNSPEMNAAWTRFNRRFLPGWNGTVNTKARPPKAQRVITGVFLLLLLWPLGAWYVLRDDEIRPGFLWALLGLILFALVVGVGLRGLSG